MEGGLAGKKREEKEFIWGRIGEREGKRGADESVKEW